MKQSIPFRNILLSLSLVVIAMASSAFHTKTPTLSQTGPEQQDLYRTIVKMDSIYFAAYNNCDMEKQAEIFADDLEFYHDMGGLSTSKSDILASLEKNICGKVTRELVKGSIEVYPIKGFGAVEIAVHKFHNNQEPDAVSSPSKFITLWKQTDDNWQITRVISLH